MNYESSEAIHADRLELLALALALGEVAASPIPPEPIPDDESTVGGWEHE